ncbi:MAG TPA: hypothetical protein VGV13_16555 [Methylomirabilota bacterium]|nr:hypothetical protein [Methylomirabilota bacterium]
MITIDPDVVGQLAACVETLALRDFPCGAAGPAAVQPPHPRP